MPELNQQTIIQVIGMVFIALGLAARLGLWKKWFWSGRGGAYAYIPMGIMFVLFTFNQRMETEYTQYYYFFVGFFVLLAILTVWWTLRTPGFVKPSWVRWVEAHPRRIVQAMKNEVEDGEEWEERVRDQEAIDAWAHSLRGKLPRRKK